MNWTSIRLRVKQKRRFILKMKTIKIKARPIKVIKPEDRKKHIVKNLQGLCIGKAYTRE